MTANLFISTLFAVSIFVFLFSMKKTKVNQDGGVLGNYLLANRGLRRSSVASLLLSSSFGLNSFFYAIIIGYSLGLYALLIQAAWSLSFILLSKYSREIEKTRSLHNFLSARFGRTTGIIAAAASIFGILIFIGWEMSIAESAIQQSLQASNSEYVNTTVLMLATLGVCLAYTVVGGMQGNAKVDIGLNFIKIISVFSILASVILASHKSGHKFDLEAIYSSDQIKQFGYIAFITNLIFNLAWQFIDSSSWHSIIAGAKNPKKDTPGTLRSSALIIFVLPGVVGGFIGMLMHAFSGVNDSNILALAGHSLNDISPALYVLFAALIVSSVMSLVDGMLLSGCYAFIVDIFFSSSSLEEIDFDENRSGKILATTRISLVFFAILSTLGVSAYLKATGITIFDFLFVVIVTQLSLIGPVLVGLMTKNTSNRMWIVIVLSIVIGFYFSAQDEKNYKDLAGAASASFSLIGAIAISLFSKALRR